MSNKEERIREISKYLEIQETNHGTIHLDLIIVPTEEQTRSLSATQKETALNSMREYKGNLIPLVTKIVRDQYGDANYEILTGFEYYLAAKELKIDNLWAWFFDLSEEQEFKLKSVMSKLLSLTETREVSALEYKIERLEINLENHQKETQEKLNQILEKLNNTSSSSRSKKVSTELESINLNTCTFSELRAIPNIGTAIANKIVGLRPFESIDDFIEKYRLSGSRNLNSFITHLRSIKVYF